ncbi:MAG: YicC family protein [Elusimicrobia bacterium]|nr:YicC family protein [Elusimicrobiota bacterium]
MESMTGYGRGEEGGIRAEIRCTNHRYCEIGLKMPTLLLPLEDEVRKIIQEKLKRGHIDINITLESKTTLKKILFKVNKDLAQAYTSVLIKMAKELDMPANISLEFLLSKVPDIIQVEETPVNLMKVVPDLKKAIFQSVNNVKMIRHREGKAIENDFIDRLDVISGVVSEIEQMTPQVIQKYRQSFEDRIKGLLKGQVVDNNQIMQEVAFYAEKVDITEEIVRLHSHLKQFGQIIKKVVPVGRELDFTLQEMNREINTIGSKVDEIVISQKVIQVKGELEKLREQVQNIV